MQCITSIDLDVEPPLHPMDKFHLGEMKYEALDWEKHLEIIYPTNDISRLNKELSKLNFNRQYN